jgi:hypothetical protein
MLASVDQGNDGGATTPTVVHFPYEGIPAEARAVALTDVTFPTSRSALIVDHVGF